MTSSRRRFATSLLKTTLTVTLMSQPVISLAQERQPSGTLTIAWQWSASTLDAQHHRSRHNQIIAHTLRDKLYYLPPPGLELAPQLAESLVQVDDTTYDVTLRKGIKYHNGDEMTSEDIVYTFTRLWDPANKSPRATMGNMANIESAESVDRYTVRFKTKIPFGPPSTAVQGLNFAAQEILHKASDSLRSLDEARSAAPTGAGPFKLEEWTPEQRTVMTAHTEYWQGAPPVEKIIWRSIPEEATRVAELLAGSVDMIYPVSPDFAQQLRDANMVLEAAPGAAIRALQMNVREGSPFHDVEVRKAMNMAIDKDAIVEHIYQGLAIPFHQVAGVGQQGFNPSYAPFAYDPKAAGEVLSKVTQPIELITTAQWELPAEFIAEQLRGYGMSVTTLIVDNATLGAISDEGKFDLILAQQGYGTGEFVGAYYTNQFQCSRIESGRVRTGFCSPELDAKYDALMAEMDPAEWQKKLDEVVRDLTEVHVPWVPLFGEAEVWAMQPYVTGFKGSSAGQMFDLHNVKIEK